MESKSSTVKYECEICDERNFKTRSDWLLHLVLSRHNAKARENIQQLYLQSSGSFYVISGLEGVDNKLLLDYISTRLSSFSNIISFKPDADISLIVCDSKEFEKFSVTSHYVSGKQLQFRDYNELKQGEWKSFFQKKKADANEGSSKTTKSEEIKEGTATQGVKRKLEETEDDKPAPPATTLIIAPQFPKSLFGLSDPGGNLNFSAATSNLISWVAEFNEIKKALLLSDGEQRVRLTVLDEMRKMFSPVYPRCVFIPVGSDFLGFGIDKHTFVFYFDRQGWLNPQNPEKKRTVDEADGVINTVGATALNILKTAHQNGIIKGLLTNPKKFEIDFTFLAFGLIHLKCKMILKPFQLAETALLCKQLFFTNEKIMSLIMMIVYWWERKPYRWRALKNPYNLYWVVYMFLIEKKILPPLIELQKTCNFQIKDRGFNVAFSYDEDIITKMANHDNITAMNLMDTIKAFLDWLEWMSCDLFMNKKVDLVRKSHFIVCLRYGVLLEKHFFKVCDVYAQAGEIKHKYKGKLKKRLKWGEKLENLGFDKGTWKQLASLKRPWALCIQHPFYIADNLSQNFDKHFVELLLDDLRESKEKIRQVFEADQEASILDAMINVNV